MLLKILILAVIVERVWEHLQQLAGEKHLTLRVKLLGSAILSVAASLAFQLDFLYALEVMAAPSLPGYILTGFVLSLGSNVIHDLIDIINGLSRKHSGQDSWALPPGR